MDGKSFLAGAIVGGVGVATVWWLLPERVVNSPDDSFTSAFEPNVERAEFIPVEPTRPDSSVLESEPIRPPTVVPPDDSDLALTAAQPNWIESRRAALANEPRDDSWAYFTEQAVEQYLAQHSEISQFTVDFIECRSTVCQIGVEGFDESAGPTWERIVFDMRQQPWYEFGQFGTSTGDVDGRLKTVTEFKRNAGN